MQRKFEKYGDVTLSRIVRNPVNGESRGFGFVDMKDDEGADEARFLFRSTHMTAVLVKLNKPFSKAGICVRDSWQLLGSMF